MEDEDREREVGVAVKGNKRSLVGKEMFCTLTESMWRFWL